jgi:formate hydrogenlyase subunit 3/multisubunit Na+/H+ antiporter MnhD subunit
VKSIVLNLVLVVLIALFSLPFLALYVLVFFGIGGGWAYAGPNGCHFVIGPIGYTMLIVPAFGLCAVGWKSIRKLGSRT